MLYTNQDPTLGSRKFSLRDVIVYSLLHFGISWLVGFDISIKRFLICGYLATSEGNTVAFFIVTQLDPLSKDVLYEYRLGGE
jgi:hypothetical protein